MTAETTRNTPGDTRRPEQGQTVLAAGHRTNCLVSGAGQPLVLLHGSGPGVSAWSNWSGVLDPLADRFRVIAPDMAGFGLSEPQESTTYSMKVWVAQLVGLLDALEIDRAALVGNSFGGGLALATALRHPDRVRALVLLGTPAGEFEQTEGLRAGWHYEPSLEEMASILGLFPHDPAVVTDAMVQTRYELSARPGAQEAFRRLIPEPAGPGTIVRGVPEDSLAQITQPSLVLHGREDAVIPVELGLRLNRCIPRSQLHIFGQCGHWVQIERRREFVALVTDFLADGEGRDDR